MWQWVLRGKHPMAKDYLSLGGKVSWAEGLTDWIDRSYEGLAKKKVSPLDLLSWRFWAGGHAGGTMLCGVLRDSTDSIGRPYPLLIVGAGALDGWERNWHCLSYVCEQTWNEVEGISTGFYRESKALEDEVRRIKHPQPDWTRCDGLCSEYAAGGDDSETGLFAKTLKDLSIAMEAGADEGTIVVPMRGEESSSDHDAIHRVHAHMKPFLRDLPPKAVFIGGNYSETCLAVFRRPLKTQDFVRLWSVGRSDASKGRGAG